MVGIVLTGENEMSNGTWKRTPTGWTLNGSPETKIERWATSYKNVFGYFATVNGKRINSGDKLAEVKAAAIKATNEARA